MYVLTHTDRRVHMHLTIQTCTEPNRNKHLECAFQRLTECFQVFFTFNLIASVCGLTVPSGNSSAGTVTKERYPWCWEAAAERRKWRGTESPQIFPPCLSLVSTGPVSDMDIKMKPRAGCRKHCEGVKSL